MGYACKVVCDSVSPSGIRLTTLEVAFPRIVLAEFNTHRVFSRNSASSRAIPVAKRIAAVEADPFIPESFGKNQKGMQAGEALEGGEARRARDTWMLSLEHAILYARVLSQQGVHKQLANRLLEPFCWHTVVVTATEWSNFLGLRCSPEAQPEIRTAAEMMQGALRGSSPTPVAVGDWHLPYVPGVEKPGAIGYLPHTNPAKVSAARCARVSYLTQDGRRDPDEDLLLAERLQTAGHMSPFEHAAKVTDGAPNGYGNFRAPWLQLRKMLPDEDDFSKRRPEHG